MTALSLALDDYLALRRSMGFKLRRAEKLLGQFVDHCEAVGGAQPTCKSVPDCPFPKVMMQTWNDDTSSMSTDFSCQCPDDACGGACGGCDDGVFCNPITYDGQKSCRIGATKESDSVPTYQYKYCYDKGGCTGDCFVQCTKADDNGLGGTYGPMRYSVCNGDKKLYKGPASFTGCDPAD